MSPYIGVDAAWMTQEEMDQMARILIYSGPLPETPFWEGDRVKLKSVSSRADPEGWVVREIDYDSPPNTDDYVYRITSTRPELRHEYWGDGLELLARGNLWKMEHGEPMSFAGIEEEGLFYKSLGMSDKIRHPMDGIDLAFDFPQAIQVLRAGGADQMKVRNKSRPDYILIKYDNEEFGERMRAHTLTKFGLE